MRAKKRAVVAMSGGVDSSVTAALMQQRGYDVLGVTMQLNGGREEQMILDAQAVCERLGIPHEVLDLRQVFRTEVIDPFLAAYLQGETPNPCVICNEKIKFGALWRGARALQAERFATGHYAQLEERDGRVALVRGADPNKDQSYFLSRIERDLLPRVRFPLGDTTKAETRAIAEDLGLEVAAKKDSQDICFIRNESYVDFLEREVEGGLQPGAIRHVDGRELGQHHGIHRYTRGQRRGLGLSAPEPLYVTDLQPGEVIVGPKEALMAKGLVTRGAHWLRWPTAPEVFTAEVKYRYRSPAVAAEVRLKDEGFEVIFAEPVRAIAPGQLAVVYLGDEVAGSGWIEGVLR